MGSYTTTPQKSSSYLYNLSQLLLSSYYDFWPSHLEILRAVVSTTSGEDWARLIVSFLDSFSSDFVTVFCTPLPHFYYSANIKMRGLSKHCSVAWKEVMLKSKLFLCSIIHRATRSQRTCQDKFMGKERLIHHQLFLH